MGKNTFDITTIDGLKKSLDVMGKNDLLLLMIPLFGPAIYANKKIKDIFSTASSESTIDAQRKAAVEIIKAGKESNVSEMEVILNQKAGFNIESELEGFPLKVTLGTNGNMTIKVSYK